MGDRPYAVKEHGSALEYTLKPNYARFAPYASEGLCAARAVLVGSRHTAESLWAAMPLEGLRERTFLGPPGVDVHTFVPRDQAGRRRGARRRWCAGSTRRSGPASTPRPPRRSTGSATRAATRRPTREELAEVRGGIRHAAASTWRARRAGRDRPGARAVVCFVGKLIVSKGVDLLLAAWPLVLAREPTRGS